MFTAELLVRVLIPQADSRQLWKMAQREERLLITTDKGFAHYRMGPHHDMFEAAELRSKTLGRWTM